MNKTWNKSFLFAGLLALTLVAGFRNAKAGVVTPPVFSSPLTINNAFYPVIPGGVKVLSGVSDGAEVTIVDLHKDETRAFTVDGNPVLTRVLQEIEFEDGEIVEISQNYFAQANDGTVYYFGETVDDYEDGVIVGHGGSWLVGGPQPGDPAETAFAAVPAVFMPPSPALGDTWKPEDVPGIADETVLVVGVNEKVSVPAGKFSSCLRVQETSPLSTGIGTKWYAPGVGLVRDKAKGEQIKLVAAHLPE